MKGYTTQREIKQSKQMTMKTPSSIATIQQKDSKGKETIKQWQHQQTRKQTMLRIIERKIKLMYNAKYWQ